MSTNKMADAGTHMSNTTQKQQQKSGTKIKYTTFIGTASSAENKVEDCLSLQEAFRKYRKARQKDIRKARRLRKRWELRKGDPSKMAALRQKFINQAKSYIGVPYAKKYWPPESPEYKSKLFLDCCGLVRQVMRDLVNDFGFYIGPWNQAYMYDTLPITVEREEDMKPGDLVFISATYYNPKCRKQRHNMTHVEIWAGHGPKTIGSRWNNGKVQIWDNYKFTAKSYYDETYHFKSIDTWLRGICESHCPDHRWKKPMYNPSKKSIFALQQDNSQNSSQDEAAGDDDDNVADDDVIVKGQPLPKVCFQQYSTEISEMKGGDTKSGISVPPRSRQIPKVSTKQKACQTRKTGGHINLTIKGKPLPKVSIQQYTPETDLKNNIDVKTVAVKLAEADIKTVRDGTLERSVREDEMKSDDLESTKVTEAENSNENLPLKNPICEESKRDTEAYDALDGNFTEPTRDISSQNLAARNMEMSNLYIVASDNSFKTDAGDLSDNKDKKSMNSTGEDFSTEDVDNDAFKNKDIILCQNEEKKFKIPWVTLGKCPVCQIDLNAIHASTPCHENRSTKNDCLVLEEIEDTGNVYENQQLVDPEAISPRPKEVIEEREVLFGNLAETAVTSESNDQSKMSEINLSTNALPKRNLASAGNSRSFTPRYDSSLPCDECHDVQPSESFVPPTEHKQMNKSKKDDSIAETQSRSEASGTADLDNPSESADDPQGSETSSKKSRGKKSPGGTKKETKLPACSLPANMQPTFFVGGGNGVALVEGPLTSLGWKRSTDKYDERFKLKWVECKSKINYGAFREGEQMVNHLPNSHLLTNKLGLLNSLKEYERVTLSTKGRLPRLKMSEFHPETYKLDEKGDRDLFLEVYKDGEIWICKPIGMNQGKGIFLIRSRESINQLLEEREQKKLTSQKPGRPLMTRIVQRYIMNPLLLDGKKFDVRAYMLIASTTPYLILYHKGYVRLSCHKYDQNDMSMSTHLTNQFIQKKDPAYKELKEETAWSMDKFNDYINDQIRPNSHVEFEEDWVYNTFTKQMQKIMIHCFNSVKHKLQCRVGFFDLFGLDFMVDTDMRVWLLEMNVNPCLARNCKALKAIIPGVIKESLFVAIECFEKSKKNLPIMPLQSLKNFTILYCGTRPNTIIPRQSRSVSPVKDNSTTATEKPKPVATGVNSRLTHRLLTQSTPIVAASNQRKSLEKMDSSHVGPLSSNRTETHHYAKTSSSTASAKVILPAIVQKSEESVARSHHRVIKSETALGKVESNTAKSEIKSAKPDRAVVKTEPQDKTIVAAKHDDDKETKENKNKDTSTSSDLSDNKLVDNKVIDQQVDSVETDNKEIEKRLQDTDEGKKSEIISTEEERRSSVVDTLTKTQNSLNLATSALGKINISLNQVGLTDSLLEEVRLKMTHAEPSVSSTKPNSVKSARARENLDRGN